MKKLGIKRLDEVIDGDDEMFAANALLEFASVSCDRGNVKFLVGFKDADGDCGSVFHGICFDGMLADFLAGFTGMVCKDLLNDEDKEIYLEDMARTPVRIVYKKGKPCAIGHFLYDRFIMEDDVKAWLEPGGSK